MTDPAPKIKYGHCFICNNNLSPSQSEDYLKCKNCGHEILKENRKQHYIVNDFLDKENLSKPDTIVKAQIAIVLRLLKDQKPKKFLIDIGCGCGKFLFHAKNYFSETLGIEVSEPSAQFARDELKLQIKPELPENLALLGIVTFWHSLEHIPEKAIDSIMTLLSAKSNDKTRVVISVPNAGSFQYKIFGSDFTYYDVPNHLHQFSSQSLDLLMKHYGFSPERNYFVFIYQVFGYVQSLLNKVFSRHNYFYYRKKRGWDYGLSAPKRAWLDGLNLALLTITGPLSLLLVLFDLIFTKRMGVITRCYRKTTFNS